MIKKIKGLEQSKREFLETKSYNALMEAMNELGLLGKANSIERYFSKNESVKTLQRMDLLQYILKILDKINYIEEDKESDSLNHPTLIEEQNCSSNETVYGRIKECLKNCIIEKDDDEVEYVLFFIFILYTIDRNHPLFEDLNIIKSNEKNLRRVIEIIHRNRWELSRSDLMINIFSSDFKELCSTAIYLPFCCPTPLSGEYVLNLLHPHQISYYHKYNVYSMRDKKGQQQTRYNNLYMRLYSSYIKDFDSYLDINMKKFFNESAVTYGKKRKGTIGEKILNEYDYASYELSFFYKFHKFPKGIHLHRKENASPKNGLARKIHKTNLLKMLNEHYASPFAMYFQEGRFETQNNYRGMLFFKTILIQNVEKDQQYKLFSAINSMKKAFKNILKISNITKKYFECIVTVKRQASNSNDMRIYDNILSEYTKWIKKKLNDFQNNSNQFIKENKKDIHITEENLYEVVFWKIFLKERIGIIKSIVHASQIPQISHGGLEEVMRYMALHPKENINVRNWEEFKEKYGEDMNDFFPNLSEKTIENTWLASIYIFLCFFPTRFSVSMRKKDLPKKLTHDWIKKHEIDIRFVTSREIFSMMYLLMDSGNWFVRVTGTDTKYYKELRENAEKVSRYDKSLQNILKNIRTHFTTKKPLMQDSVLMLQTILWMTEEDAGFFMKDDAIKFFREANTFLMDIYKTRIVGKGEINQCVQNAEALTAWIDSSLIEVENLMMNLSNNHPNLRSAIANYFPKT